MLTFEEPSLWEDALVRFYKIWYYYYDNSIIRLIINLMSKDKIQFCSCYETKIFIIKNHKKKIQFQSYSVIYLLIFQAFHQNHIYKNHINKMSLHYEQCLTIVPMVIFIVTKHYNALHKRKIVMVNRTVMMVRMN